MKAWPEGLRAEDINRWVDDADANPLNWTLKRGAPQHLIDLWPQYIELMTTPDGPQNRDWVGPETRGPKDTA